MKYSSFSTGEERERKKILKGIEVVSQWNFPINNTNLNRKGKSKHCRFLSENNNLYHLKINSFNSENSKQRKVVVYDILPTNATHEKKSCFFRNKNNLNLDNMNSSLISSALSNMKGDTNYEDVNRSLSSLNDFMNNSSNTKPFYVNSIDTSMIKNTDGNVDFSKIKRNKNNKITNLDILISNKFR